MSHARLRSGPFRAVLVALAALITMALAVGAPTAAKAQTSTTPEERASALIEPSIVFIGIEMQYWIDIKEPGVAPLGPYSFEGACTGFFVSPDGYIVTAGHCTNTEPGGALAFNALSIGLDDILNTLLSMGEIDRMPTDAEYAELLQHAYMNWELEGQAAGSSPDLTITVYQPIGVAGEQASSGKTARVVESTKFEDGDVSLLKIEQTNTPVAIMGTDDDVSNGTAILAAGYPGNMEAAIDPSNSPTFKDGKINSKGTREGLKVAVYEMSAAAAKGMSGGPVVDMDGKVIGVISYGLGDGFEFISPSKLAQELLSRNNVNNEPSNADKAYREGLEAYFSGDYAKAVEQFDKTLGIVPSHYLAQQYKQKANAKLADSPQTTTTAGQSTSKAATTEKSSSSSGILFVIIGIVVLLGIVAVILVVVMKGKGNKGTPPAPGAGTPVPPVPPVATPPAPTAPQAAPTAPPAAPAAPTAPVPPAAPTGTEPTAPQAATGAFCSQCGNPLTAGERFCGSCGKDQQA